MKSFLKFIGIQQETGGSTPPKDPQEETESIRHIIESLDSLPAEQARYLALFASILSRVAYADLHMSEIESREVERILMAIGHLEEPLAVLVTEIAKNQNRLLGGIENYLITREFQKIASREQSFDLLEALFAVAAAEEGISAHENAEIKKIAQELGLSQKDFLAVRVQFKKDLGVFQGMPKD